MLLPSYVILNIIYMNNKNNINIKYVLSCSFAGWHAVIKGPCLSSDVELGFDSGSTNSSPEANVDSDWSHFDQRIKQYWNNTKLIKKLSSSELNSRSLLKKFNTTQSFKRYFKCCLYFIWWKVRLIFIKLLDLGWTWSRPIPDPNLNLILKWT